MAKRWWCLTPVWSEIDSHRYRLSEDQVRRHQIESGAFDCPVMGHLYGPVMLPRMAVFIGLLAPGTAFCRQIGQQALDLDISLAIEAHPIPALGDSDQRLVDLPDFFDVHIKDRKVQVHQEISHGLFLEIVDLAGKVYEMLIVGPEQFEADFFSEIMEPFFQSGSEISQLAICHHDKLRG
jgi:hypothetical protein